MDDLIAAAQQAASSLFSSAVSGLDQNGDGTLDIHDLPPLLRISLESLDSNGDGLIDASELAPLLQAQLANSDGFIDLHDFLDEGEIARLAAEHLTQFGDINEDGMIDERDLTAILENAGDITLDALPEDLRERLVESLDSNGDGAISDADVAPLVAALQSTAVGAHALGSLGDGEGNFSIQQLFLAYSALEGLRNAKLDGDSVDLSGLTPGLRDALLQDLDVDKDGKLSLAVTDCDRTHQPWSPCDPRARRRRAPPGPHAHPPSAPGDPPCLAGFGAVALLARRPTLTPTSTLTLTPTPTLTPAPTSTLTLYRIWSRYSARSTRAATRPTRRCCPSLTATTTGVSPPTTCAHLRPGLCTL